MSGFIFLIKTEYVGRIFVGRYSYKQRLVKLPLRSAKIALVSQT